jgi:hypothetical protein
VIRLKIIEEATEFDFIVAFEAFAKSYDVILDAVKFQRNLYYAGIGSSAGRTPGSEKGIDDAELEKSFVAFIPYRECEPMEDTRYAD